MLGARQRALECRLKLVLADDLSADVADKAAFLSPQQAQLPTMALELPSIGIASHRFSLDRKLTRRATNILIAPYR
ncbi:UNVERIFIED_ORG: hypothetical protein M2193_002253 [Bradyrhizobium japonicum]|jgi:hypothetical protein|uniref:Uncharacterized protein n=1 Tax=Bradyrhizobium diazoefficiens TaxID=1355477 RepID=A0A809XB75_9BRAD|nr:hypothetical protein [Bradyrhizobium diazoefficiens]AWO93168.1 hypothetical protein DI395_34865 [Bradyrhizobium diazoefficiens]WLA78194.1 hypothetical protein QIH77_15025 [Bradyrhizobium diazoefficiens]BCE24239.1 hypothetical protein XF1B_69200 [Bradyrhizobium diazoefficiens]BCE50496.1 hypothetical protein XF4B_68450 [Bradyrhizobium diazoefficiens]BCE93999.1 hypothetical protein XF10B_67970 [Bradyrhizobium diazoefficiens]